MEYVTVKLNSNLQNIKDAWSKKEVLPNKKEEAKDPAKRKALIDYINKQFS